MRKVPGSMLRLFNFFLFVTCLLLVNIILFTPIDSNSLSGQLFLCYQGKNRKNNPFKSEKQIGKGML